MKRPNWANGSLLLTQQSVLDQNHVPTEIEVGSYFSGRSSGYNDADGGCRKLRLVPERSTNRRSGYSHLFVCRIYTLI